MAGVLRRRYHVHAFVPMMRVCMKIVRYTGQHITQLNFSSFTKQYDVLTMLVRCVRRVCKVLCPFNNRVKTIGELLLIVESLFKIGISDCAFNLKSNFWH